LKEQIDPLEAQRFEAMQPLRSYVMKNYRILKVFGDEVVFQALSQHK
jgi:hypothetical protein